MMTNAGLRESTDPQIAARLRLVLTRLTRSVRQHGSDGLTPSQLSALAMIEDRGPLRMSDLAEWESVGASVVTRIVASLEELGYVARSDDSSDRRACLIELTEKGQDFLRNLWSARTAGINSRIAALSSADAQLLVAALPVLEKLAREQS